MKVSCVKRGHVVVSLETREEIAWLRAALAHVQAKGGWSRLVTELTDAAGRAARAPRVCGMAVTLKSSRAIVQLKALLAAAHEPVADALGATLATVAAWGPVTHRWATPPPVESLTATPTRRMALRLWRRRLAWILPGKPA